MYKEFAEEGAKILSRLSSLYTMNESHIGRRSQSQTLIFLAGHRIV